MVCVPKINDLEGWFLEQRVVRKFQKVALRSQETALCVKELLYKERANLAHSVFLFPVTENSSMYSCLCETSHQEATVRVTPMQVSCRSTP